MTEISWSVEPINGPELWPHSSAGNEVILTDQNKITLFIDLAEEKNIYPNLTIDQARMLKWALDKAIREYNKRK